MRYCCTTLITTILVIVTNLLCTQVIAQVQHTCHTMERYDKKAPIESFPLNERLQNLEKGPGTWSLQNGYGPSCADVSDCSITLGNGRLPNAQACDSDPCGNGTGVYLIPVRITIFQDDNGSNQAADIAHVRDQVADMNTYHCCQGIPIQFYEITNSPVFVQSTVENNGGVGTTNTSYNESNYFNILVANDTGNGTGCNGFAYLPGSVNSSGLTVMGGACFNANGIADPCTNTEEGLVLFHEVGHSLGLYHTHDTGVSDDPAVMTDDCSSGDFIADTDEDPDYSGGEIGFTGCNTGGATPNCAFNNSADPACSPYGSPNTTDNVMSYNNFQGCRQNYTTCQKAKMVDALLCARPYCDPDLSRYFSNAADATIEICVNDPIPTFTADMRTCIEWYAAESGGTMLASGASFTPTSTQVDVGTPGTYEVFFQDVNGYEPSRCRKVTVIVLSDPGDGVSTNTQCVTGMDIINLSTLNTQLQTDEVVGWWITDGSSISNSVSDQITLDAAITGATVSPANDGSAITGSPSLIFNNSEVGGGLVVDCGLMGNTTFYATPILAEERPAIADMSCIVPITVGNTTIGGDAGKRANIGVGTIPCAPTTHASVPTFTLTVTVSDFTGTDLRLRVRNGGCPLPNLIATSGNTNGTFTFTQADFSAGFDPNVNGLCVLAYESGSNLAENITMTVSLDITYPGVPAIPFPTMSYNMGCAFGDAIPFMCSDFDVIASPVDCADTAAPFDVAFDFLDPTPSPNYTISGVVGGTLTDDGTLSGATGDGIIIIADAAGCETSVPISFAPASYAGAAASVTDCVDGVGMVNVLTSGSTISAEQILGFYFSSADPTATQSATSGINSAISGATNGTPLNAGTGNVIQANSGTPATDLTGLSIDCNALGAGEYFLTPFVAQGEAEINCNSSANDGTFNWSNGAGGSSAQISPISACTVPASYSLTDYEVVVDVNTCSNAGSTVRVELQFDCNGSFGIGGAPSLTLNCSAGETLVFDQAFIDGAFGAGFDPMVNQVCVVMINSNFSGALNIDYTATLNATYQGDNALTIWNNNSAPSIDAANASCFWGTPISITCDCSLVPVEMLAFTGKLKDDKVILDWATASELDNDHFIVECSQDGRKFSPIGKVQGIGTTIEMQRYQYLDLAPEFGLNYYRLKQVDTDGTYEYSDIVSVNLAKDELTAKVYPSPTNSFLNVEISKEMNALEILDLTGRVLISKSYEDTKFTQINVSNLPVGTYFVNLQLENTIKVLRFVKN